MPLGPSERSQSQNKWRTICEREGGAKNVFTRWVLSSKFDFRIKSDSLCVECQHLAVRGILCAVLWYNDIGNDDMKIIVIMILIMIFIIVIIIIITIIVLFSCTRTQAQVGFVSLINSHDVCLILFPREFMWCLLWDYLWCFSHYYCKTKNRWQSDLHSLSCNYDTCIFLFTYTVVGLCLCFTSDCLLTCV